MLGPKVKICAEPRNESRPGTNEPSPSSSHTPKEEPGFGKGPPRNRTLIAASSDGLPDEVRRVRMRGWGPFAPTAPTWAAAVAIVTEPPGAGFPPNKVILRGVVLR